MKSFTKAETGVLQETLQDVSELKYSIEQASLSLNAGITALPASTVRTIKLYRILVCYEELYAKLLKYELIKTTNTLENFNIH